MSSLLSDDNGRKIYRILNQRLVIGLGSWRHCPVRLVGPGLQVVDHADPDAPPMPGPDPGRRA